MPHSAIHCAIVPQMCHRCATGFGASQSPKRGKVPKCHGFFKKMFSSKIGAFGILMGKSRKREKILMRAFLALSPKPAGVRPRAIVAPPRPTPPGAGSHCPGPVPNGSATPGSAPSVARPLSIIDATPPGASFAALLSLIRAMSGDVSNIQSNIVVIMLLWICPDWCLPHHHHVKQCLHNSSNSLHRVSSMHQRPGSRPAPGAMPRPAGRRWERGNAPRTKRPPPGAVIPPAPHCPNHNIRITIK